MMYDPYPIKGEYQLGSFGVELGYQLDQYKFGWRKLELNSTNQPVNLLVSGCNQVRVGCIKLLILKMGMKFVFFLLTGNFH